MAAAACCTNPHQRSQFWTAAACCPLLVLWVIRGTSHLVTQQGMDASDLTNLLCCEMGPREQIGQMTCGPCWVHFRPIPRATSIMRATVDPMDRLEESEPPVAPFHQFVAATGRGRHHTPRTVVWLTHSRADSKLGFPRAIPPKRRKRQSTFGHCPQRRDWDPGANCRGQSACGQWG